MTLCNHGGAGASGGSYPGAMSIAKYEISMMARICPMDLLVFGGVFERHPSLRLVLTESPGNWWKFVLQEMDSIYLTDTRSYGPSEKERVPRLPSEYAREQVFIGASFHARFEAEEAIAQGYADRVIWGSDYPHFEGTYQYGADGPNGEPMTWAALRFHYAGLPIDAVESFLAGNAMRAYDLDYDALAKVAARINAPTYADLNSTTVSTSVRKVPATSRSARSGSGPSPTAAGSVPVSDDLQVERRGAVLVVTIDRQDRMNALSQEVHDDLLATWTGLKADPLRPRDRHQRRRRARVLHWHGPQGVRRARWPAPGQGRRARGAAPHAAAMRRLAPDDRRSQRRVHWLRVALRRGRRRGRVARRPRRSSTRT